MQFNNATSQTPFFVKNRILRFLQSISNEPGLKLATSVGEFQYCILIDIEVK